MEEPSQSTTSQLCRNGCGFYGTAQNEGMCSKCYKENVQKNSSSGRKSPSAHPIVSPVKTEIPSTPNRKDLSVQFSTAELVENVPLKERHSEVAVSSSMAALATSDSLSNSCSNVTSLPTATTATVTTSISHVPASSDIDTSSANQDVTTSTASSPASSCPATPNSDDSPSKPKKSRCATCRKRVGLTGFNCRCGKIFCGIHRYSDQHNCDYDYRADAQAKIRKENPVVVGEKVQKI